MRGGAHAHEEAPVEARVVGAQGPVTLVGVEEHGGIIRLPLTPRSPFSDMVSGRHHGPMAKRSEFVEHVVETMCFFGAAAAKPKRVKSREVPAPAAKPAKRRYASAISGAFVTGKFTEFETKQCCAPSRAWQARHPGWSPSPR